MNIQEFSEERINKKGEHIYIYNNFQIEVNQKWFEIFNNEGKKILNGEIKEKGYLVKDTKEGMTIEVVS